MKNRDYGKGLWNPYFAGLMLGLVLLATFYIMGSGLGASGAIARTAVVTAHVVAPQAVESNGYMAGFYKPGKKFPLVNWIVFEVLGVFIGGFLGAITGGRLRPGITKGENTTNGTRLIMALIGGSLWGIGTRFAMGCTSGQALSGGATMVLGSWVVMMAVFAGAFVFALVVRRQWT